MSSELLAILLLVVVHLVAIAVLALMLAGDGFLRGWWPTDGGPDDGGSPPPDDRPRGGPPLGEAAQSSLRLRGTGRLAEARRTRRTRTSEPGTRPAPVRNSDVPSRDGTVS